MTSDIRHCSGSETEDVGGARGVVSAFVVTPPTEIGEQSTKNFDYNVHAVLSDQVGRWDLHTTTAPELSPTWA